MSGVVIGSITLSDFEAPEQISFGGEQRLVVHRLPGGGRVIDAMGADDGNISWSGMMIGENASARARMLDRLRQSGDVVLLLFGDMAFQVVVASFEADYRRSTWIGGYRISCVVAPAAALAATVTIGAAIVDDLATIGQIDPTGVLAGISAPVAAAQAALAGQAALVAGASAAVSVNGALGDLSMSVQAAQATAEAALGVAVIENGGGPSVFSGVSLQMEQLAKSVAIVGLAGRAAINLSAAAL